MADSPFLLHSSQEGWRTSPFTSLKHPPTQGARQGQNHLYKSQTSRCLCLLGKSIRFGFTIFICSLTFSPVWHTSEEMGNVPYTLLLNTPIYQDMWQNSKKYSLLFIPSGSILPSLQTCISLVSLYIKLMAHNPSNVFPRLVRESCWTTEW